MTRPSLVMISTTSAAFAGNVSDAHRQCCLLIQALAHMKGEALTSYKVGKACAFALPFGHGCCLCC
jgi:hypothetical protein